MGKLKNLISSLRDAEAALRDYDPVSYDTARRMIEEAEDIAFSLSVRRPKEIQPREDQTQIPLERPETLIEKMSREWREKRPLD